MIIILIVKREKGVEIGRIHFYNIFVHLWFKRVFSLHVATLALGSQPRQGLARLRAKREARGSHFMLPRVQKSVRE
jgi:hypothetical protein